MDKFVRENMKYPIEAIEDKIEGDVLVEYRVGSHGKVLDAKVKKGIGYGCDKEALRLVKLLRFKAQTNKKVKVYHNLSITIHFKLPKQRKARPKAAPKKPNTTAKKKVVSRPKKSPGVKTVYNYTLVPAKSDKEKPKTKKGRVYNFKIKTR